MKKKRNKNKSVLITIIKILVMAALITGIILATVAFSIDYAVKKPSKGKILTLDEASELTDVDCIIVLGCGVTNGEPTPMLNDRIIMGEALCNTGITDILLMSGDSRAKSHDETGIMKRVAVEHGINKEAILCDGYGLSTYDSMYRAAKLYGCKKIVIVTQKYHLYRAIYIADHFGIDAYGVAADTRKYSGQNYRDLREFAARFKDFAFCVLEPKPDYGVTLWEGFK